jgi:RNA polymerase sigma factor (sigma-70 family)
MDCFSNLSETATLNNRMVIEYRLRARKLARSLLKKWRARLDVQEIDSIVDLSLCEAVSRYDETKGASFMTFLFYHLRGNLIRTITIAANQITVCSQDIEDEAGRKLSGGESDGHNWDVASPDRPDDILVKKQLVSLSREALHLLDPLEKEIIHRIYHLGEQVQDIADSFGYSRCHVSRVKKQALETLFRYIAEVIYTEEELKASSRFKWQVNQRRMSSRRLPVRSAEAA